MLKIIADMAMRMYHSNIFVTANVSSWLFEGVQDPILDLVGHIPGLPYTIPFDRFGWFYKVRFFFKLFKVQILIMRLCHKRENL